jgi:hypothetical protein
MRRLTALLFAGTCLLVAGCGGSHPATTAAADPQVNAGLCQLSGGAAKPSCTFVLEDGRRLGCNRSFAGSTPTVSELVRDGCRWLTPLKVSRSMRAVIARINSVKGCLRSKAMRVAGGPAFPSRPLDPTQPDGEVVISSSHPTFIAFYTDVAKAKRIEPALRRDDARTHVLLERRGAATIAWSQPPAGQDRHAVLACLS